MRLIKNKVYKLSISAIVMVLIGCALVSPGPDHALTTNKQCFKCHKHFDEDKFTAKHARHDVGCINCHGPSAEHMADEKHLTPPDRMYPREKIRPACFKCHKQDGKLARIKEHKKPFAPESKKACTDCHGKKHKIEERKIAWDKATGKLISNKE